VSDGDNKSGREGSLEAPTRHALAWQEPQFYDAEALDKELAARGIKLDAVLELEVDEDALLDRIRGRAKEAASRGEPVRRDDNPEVFKTRLHVYREQTAPVTEYYRSRGLLNIVDGLQPIDLVTEQLAAALAALPSRQIRSDVQ